MTKRELTVMRKKSMSKKALAQYNKAQRVMDCMNTGTRTHKSKKDYNRRDNQRVIAKALKEC